MYFEGCMLQCSLL